jgi:hypothetical protein
MKSFFLLLLLELLQCHKILQQCVPESLFFFKNSLTQRRYDATWLLYWSFRPLTTRLKPCLSRIGLLIIWIPGGSHSRVRIATLLINPFKVAYAPTLVEVALGRRVEAEKDPPALSGNDLDPVLLFALRCLGSVIQIRRAIRVLDKILP